MDMVLEGGRTAAMRPWEGGEELAQLVDELAHGMLVASLQGRLLHANQAALQELARGRVITARHGALQACGADNGRVLANALRQAGGGRRSLITLSGPDAVITVAVVPLRQPQTSEHCRVALVFARASVCDSLMLCFFARGHGLTPTEELVLGILCQGFSAPDIARQMRVAVSTVRSHVRSLCAKTRSSGVRELVSRVAVLPPVACAPLH
ncbi:helix-turn-helix transcriptional regulator [Ramlibacter tataouinensis]|uniref:Transcriptional regulator, LuxR family-like protein n=1 Tax=Ramlibacter tataouinensis (strain ATCC BAA-407 / DSM 14655 / LMG 21543 / TTB310) TaxID=365046 RepID=F5XW53_RAMTT|nr:LuxR C-terminal-related transcriptional regulator [Ramlibacter tataouinensis]AEG91623.1 transcriptional regulator, LuxR family-like protein [Ramlibacter tataouinensis TTB310]